MKGFQSMQVVKSDLNVLKMSDEFQYDSSITQPQTVGYIWCRGRLILAVLGSVVTFSDAYGTHFGFLSCEKDCGPIPVMSGQIPPNGLHVDVSSGAIVIRNGAGAIVSTPESLASVALASVRSPLTIPKPSNGDSGLWTEGPSPSPGNKGVVVYAPTGNGGQGGVELIFTDGGAIDATAAITASGTPVAPWNANCSLSGSSTSFSADLTITVQGGCVLPSVIQCTAGMSSTSAVVPTDYAAGPISLSSPCSAPDQPISCSLSPSGISASPERVATVNFVCGPQGP